MEDLGLITGYVAHAGDKEYSLGKGIVALPIRALLSDYSLIEKL